ncbi:MAG: hypothetical protein AB7J32_21050 [Pseudonocardia sp.]
MLLLGAGPAAAHGGDMGAPGPDEPRILSVEPAAEGLGLTVIEGGLRLRIDNATAAPVQVAHGPVLAPGTSLAWADPRLEAPVWEVGLQVGDLPVTVTGDRIAPPPPDPVPWWSFTLAAALLTFAAGVTAARRGAPASRVLAGLTLLTVAAYAVHVLGASLVLATPPGFTTLLAAAGPGVACWLIGIAGAVLVLREHPLGVPACATAGALAALLTVFDTTSFHRAVLAFGWSYDLDRLTVVLTLGCGIGLAAAGLAVLSREEAPA